MQAHTDSILRDYAGKVPGASVLVLHDGKAVVRHAHGQADLEAGIAATPATNYRLASISKQFTAAAILLLAEQGALALDDRARRWLPELPSTQDAITIHHLLSHTSGLIDYEDIIPADRVEPLRDADVLALLEHEPRRHFAPGSAWRYSNSGYALLALIVERASGKTFPAFLRERIFVPLGMQDSLAYVEGAPAIARRAFGYSSIDGKWMRTDQSLTSSVLGDGGIYSSIDDLARWDAAWYDDRLLDVKSRQLATTAWTHSDDPAVDYGYGWRLTADTEWHSGETIGFRNVIVRWPRQRLTVIVLSNRDDPEPYHMALEIGRAFIGR